MNRHRKNYFVDEQTKIMTGRTVLYRNDLISRSNGPLSAKDIKETFGHRITGFIKINKGRRTDNSVDKKGRLYLKTLWA